MTPTPDSKLADKAIHNLFSHDGGFIRPNLPRSQVFAILAIHAALARIADALEAQQKSSSYGSSVID